VVPIKVATDEQLVIDGVATVPLRVGGRSTVTDVLVTRDITGLILGVDWMTRQGPLTWDFQNARVRFGKGEWIDLQISCAPDHTPIQPQFWGCSRCIRSPMLGVNECMDIKLFGREIIFEEFQPM